MVILYSYVNLPEGIRTIHYATAGAGTSLSRLPYKNVRLIRRLV